MLAIWDDGVWQDAASIAVIILVAYGLVLWVAALVWTYRDITSRTHDQATHAISVVMVLIFNLPGLLLYLILRPKTTLAEQYDRQLEAEALLHEIQEQAACPSCRRKVEHEFVACPYCRAALRTPCDSCARALAFGWVLCPYCGADRPGAPVSQREPAPVAAQAAPSPEAQPQPRQRLASTATYTPSAKPAPTPAPAATDATTLDAGSQP